MSAPAQLTKLLIFAADPSDAARLRLGLEIREIETSRRQATNRDQYAIEQSFATRPGDLSRRILTQRPSLVHFSGHGTGAGGLALEDDRGTTQLVSTDALASLFKLFEGQIQCVVLNACFSAVQAEALARHVPYVIGMSQEIGDRAAIDFSRGFYDALFEGETIERAFEFGRTAIHLESLPTAVKGDLAARALRTDEVSAALPEYLKPVLLKTSAPPVGQPLGPVSAPEGQRLSSAGESRTSLPEADWELLLNNIADGKCTPFLGAEVYDRTLPLRADIARSWAKEFDYPFDDSGDLVRVAQYLAVTNDPLTPKDLMLKNLRGVNVPNFKEQDEPHGVLARLPLPVYLTTNYDDFLFRALTARNKAPRREMCRWNDLTKGDPSIFETDPAYKPHPSTPLVFHLHGHTAPEALVLTEDDYLQYLAAMVGEWDALIPPPVRDALNRNALLFIGYQLGDWNFRVLLQGLRPSAVRRSYVVMSPPQEPGTAPAKAQAYLEKFYARMGLQIFWATAREFCGELRRRWREREDD